MDLSPIAPARLAMLRMQLTYLWRHHRFARIGAPQRFTELVQLRKLCDRDARMPLLADKVAVKDLVAQTLGSAWVTPTLWSGTVLPTENRWRGSVMVKARHGCRQGLVVHPDGNGADAGWAHARKASRRWMRGPYGSWLDEWLYPQIPLGLLVEPFVGAERALPLDYKIYVFGGQATHVQVHIDRADDHRWIMHDRQWTPLRAAGVSIPQPSGLNAMLAAAEELAGGFSFARVDFYQPEAQPLFSEITFYPGSGLDGFDPPELDMQLGALWLDALRRQEKSLLAASSAGDKIAA